MLGKLISYEMRALWKPAAVMFAIMVVAGLAGAGCLSATEAVSSAAHFDSQSLGASLSSNAVIVLVMAALFCGFLVWAAVVALYVYVVMRFYRTMFTDEGYLTLALPVGTGALVAAKFLAAYLLLAVFSFAAMLLYSFMVWTVSGGDIDAVGALLSIMGGWFAFVAEGDAASTLLGIVNTLVTCAYALGLAFVSLTLGAWWARRHKVAAAVGIYLGVSWLLSLAFSVAGVLVMAGSASSWDFALGAVSVVQLLANVAVAAGGLLLSAYLVRTKVDLS